MVGWESVILLCECMSYTLSAIHTAANDPLAHCGDYRLNKLVAKLLRA